MKGGGGRRLTAVAQQKSILGRSQPPSKFTKTEIKKKLFISLIILRRLFLSLSFFFSLLPVIYLLHSKIIYFKITLYCYRGWGLGERKGKLTGITPGEFKYDVIQIP